MSPTPGNTSVGLIGAIKSWYAKPFNTTGSALNWVLFLGLLIIAVWFWNVILLHIEGDL